MTNTTIENILEEFNRNQRQWEWQREDLRAFMGDGTKPNLEGFEKVLGRKFTCGDCQYLRKIIGEKRNLPEWNEFWASDSYVCPMGWESKINSFKLCSEFKLSDATKAEIKLHDYELYPAGKIDIHPWIFVSNNIHYYIKPEPVSLNNWILSPNKIVEIRQARIKLELIL